MSGIAGIFYRDGRPVERAEVARMVDAISHRGPDGAGVWVDGSVGLGHRMLHTTPESLHERLPLTSRCGNYTITADARIDNRDELIPLLGLNDRPRELIGDTEIILAAYMQWGERCPEQLLGDFAFAIWDARKQQLFCARDFFGVKPFHYFISTSLFVIASELKAILCLAEIPRRINEAKVVEYFVPLLEGSDEISTIYSDLFCLPAGYSLKISEHTLDKHQYRKIDISYELRLRSDSEYAEAFLAHFSRAVQCRLRVNGPAGAMLSGGVDSSSIVCVAQRLLDVMNSAPLRTFSATYAEAVDCPERPYISAVLRDTHVHATILKSDQLEPYTSIFTQVVQNSDDPFGPASLAVVTTMYFLAHQQKLRVLLDGVDGDLVASLDDYYPMYLFRQGVVRTGLKELRGMSRIYESSLWRVVLDSCIWPIMPPHFQRGWLEFRQGAPLPIPTSVPLSAEFIERQHIRERVQAEYARLFHLEESSRIEHGNQIIASSFTAALDRYDKVSAALSIEARHPILDRRVVDFCLALPIEQQRRDGWTKVIMRNAMHGILPEDVRWRRDRRNPSIGYIQSYLTLFTNNIEVRFEDLVGKLADFLKVDDTLSLYHRYQQHKSPEGIIAVWTVLQFSLWLNHIIYKEAINAKTN